MVFSRQKVDSGEPAEFGAGNEVVGEGAFVGELEFEQHAFGIDEIDKFQLSRFVGLAADFERLIGFRNETLFVQVYFPVGIAELEEGLPDIGFKRLFSVFKGQLCGGALVIGDEFAWVDRRGRPHGEEVLRAFEEHRDRVLTNLSRWIETDNASRYRARFEVDTLLPGLLSQLGVHPRFSDKGGLDLPCVRSRRLLPDGRILVTYLPNTATREEREAHLLETQAAIVPDESYELEWLYPPGAEQQGGLWLVDLPPGDAAVFLLTPKE